MFLLPPAYIHTSSRAVAAAKNAAASVPVPFYPVEVVPTKEDSASRRALEKIAGQPLGIAEVEGGRSRRVAFRAWQHNSLPVSSAGRGENSEVVIVFTIHPLYSYI
jgi:hypothetical protein